MQARENQLLIPMLHFVISTMYKTFQQQLKMCLIKRRRKILTEFLYLAEAALQAFRTCQWALSPVTYASVWNWLIQLYKLKLLILDYRQLILIQSVIFFRKF